MGDGWVDALQGRGRAGHLSGMKQVQTKAGRKYIARVDKIGMEGC